MYIRLYLCMFSTLVYVCMILYVCVCMYLCTNVSSCIMRPLALLSVCTYIRKHIYIHACMHVFLYTYIQYYYNFTYEEDFSALVCVYTPVCYVCIYVRRALKPKPRTVKQIELDENLRPKEKPSAGKVGDAKAGKRK